MRRLISLAVLGAAIAPPTSAAPAPVVRKAVKLSPAAQKDVVCFMLFAGASNDPDVATDASKRQALTLGLTYFLGKLAVESPGLNLADAIRQEAEALRGKPDAKQIAGGCDAEFGKVGSDLHDLGQEMQKDAPPVPTPAPTPPK